MNLLYGCQFSIELFDFANFVQNLCLNFQCTPSSQLLLRIAGVAVCRVRQLVVTKLPHRKLAGRVTLKFHIKVKNQIDKIEKLRIELKFRSD